MDPALWRLLAYTAGILCLASCLEVTIRCARAAFRGNSTALYFTVIGTVIAFSRIAAPRIALG